MTIKYKYMKEEPGFLRVYYKKIGTAQWYCIQNNGSFGEDKFEFCPCTQDGEPLYERIMPEEREFNVLILPKSIKRGEDV